MRRRKRKTKSWNEHHLLTTAEEATETWTNLADLLLCGTGGAGAGLQEGEAALRREEAHRHAERGIAAKARGDTGADPGRGGTDRDLNLQVIIVVTDTEVIPNHLKDLRKVTRRAGEGMNNQLNPAHSSGTLNCSQILSYLHHGTAGYVLAALAVHFFNPPPVQVLFVCF